jgi:predicted GH43/DUF377 family glycosyl hydrolase
MKKKSSKKKSKLRKNTYIKKRIKKRTKISRKRVKSLRKRSKSSRKRSKSSRKRSKSSRKRSKSSRKRSKSSQKKVKRSKSSQKKVKRSKSSRKKVKRSKSSQKKSKSSHKKTGTKLIQYTKNYFFAKDLTPQLTSIPDPKWLPYEYKDITIDNVIKLNCSLVHISDDLYYLAYRTHTFKHSVLNNNGYKLPIMWGKTIPELTSISQEKYKTNDWGNAIGHIGIAKLNITHNKIDVISDNIINDPSIKNYNQQIEDPRLYKKSDGLIYISYGKYTDGAVRIHEGLLSNLLNFNNFGNIICDTIKFPLYKTEKGWSHWTYKQRDYLIYQLYDVYFDSECPRIKIDECDIHKKHLNDIIHFEYKNKICQMDKYSSSAVQFFKYFYKLVTFSNGSPSIPINYNGQLLYVSVGHNRIKATSILTNMANIKNDNKNKIINNQLSTSLKEYKKRLYKHIDVYMMFIYMFNPETGEIIYISNSFYPPSNYSSKPFSLVYTSGLCRSESNYLISYGEGDVMLCICRVSDEFLEKNIGMHKMNDLVQNPQKYEFKFF